jgi:uncharacterized protein (TIGR02391 family)
MASTPQPPWPDAVLEKLCAVLASTEWPGLSGSELGRQLQISKIADPDPDFTKRHRLLNALAGRQNSDQSSHRLVTFVVGALAPARYIDDPARFDALQHRTNEVLAMVGLRVTDEGKMARVRQAQTLDQVAELAGRLRGAMKRRAVHPQVLVYCEVEVLRRSIFHAVFEATKGLAERIRKMTGSTLDGAELVDACFAKVDPVIRINAHGTKSETSEHSGFANLLRGVFGTFRNPVAHAPRTEWTVSEADALDLFSTLSYLHRRLDQATVTRQFRP